ncbi:MAG: MBL fold metallo-hydrolase [Bacteroidales bacterium]|jgi:phosphoribosyl 1,2-cyclic phosphodiesterase|nr:MBL fold metallo-hydrolase [Bacteroidales bacterium]
MSQVQLRVNGRGNAWPVLLGLGHPFYNQNNYMDLANASCSLVKTNTNTLTGIEWELLIDAGHGIVQYLLKNHNRIPEAVLLTHPHIDHFLGIDWIVQSYYKVFHKPYPVYATCLTWKKILKALPHLEMLVDFQELIPYSPATVKEIPSVQVTAYPVYHGQNAEGAAMFLLETKNKKILLTGDLLCPLLREEDFRILNRIDLLVTDANNRYPYPESNHWSIVAGNNDLKASRLQEFIEHHSIGLLLTPHLKPDAPESYVSCFDYFLEKSFSLDHFIFDNLSFIRRIQPKKVTFLHYSGAEDEKYYQQSLLNPSALKSWIEKQMNYRSLAPVVIIPFVGQCIDF